MQVSRRSIQAPSSVVMIRPRLFMPNPETAVDNKFQSKASHLVDSAIAQAAYDEVTQAVIRLETEGVRVHLFEDLGNNDTPDSVFPNNWFSTHSGGHIAIYPMYSPNRRWERRNDVIEMLKKEYRVQGVIDYSGLEADGLFLEGTGTMVFDHLSRIAFTARSNRADPIAYRASGASAGANRRTGRGIGALYDRRDPPFAAHITNLHLLIKWPPDDAAEK